MTDEEKAIKNLCIKCSYDFCKKGNQLHCAETVAYIKGLAEGRLENFNLASVAKVQRDEARKENRELKCKIEAISACIETEEFIYANEFFVCPTAQIKRIISK